MENGEESSVIMKISISVGKLKFPTNINHKTGKYNKFKAFR